MAATVYQAFVEAARQWPEHPFLCVTPETAQQYQIEAGELSYRQVLGTIETLKTAYDDAGYGQGQRVGLLLENRPDFLLHWFALNALGVSVVPINPDLRLSELSYLIEHSGIVLAVAWSERHALLAQAAQQVQHPLMLMAPNQTPPASAAADTRSPAGPAGSASECALLYTSGTTGLPKGCLLPNEYFLYAGRWYAELNGLVSLQQGCERMLTPLPLVHMNAMACSVMAMILTGGCLIILDRFHPRSWWATVRSSRATVVHYLGVMPAILMKAAQEDQDRKHHVRFGFGAGVDASLHAPFEERFGFPLLEAWAMTETGCGAAIIANHEPRYVGTHCFGQESPDVEVLLVNDEGSPVGIEQDGHLLVRRAGPNPRFGFFAGYLKDEEETKKVWTDGWFHTGDVVRRGTHGQLHFVDRAKNVIRRSGENIAAVEVENALLQHPAIKSIAVTAVADALRGDEVLACIVAHEHPDEARAAPLAHDIVAWALQQLAYYKAPGYIAFVEELPLTATNKLARGHIKSLAPDLLGLPLCVDTRPLKKRQEPLA